MKAYNAMYAIGPRMFSVERSLYLRYRCQLTCAVLWLLALAARVESAGGVASVVIVWVESHDCSSDTERSRAALEFRPAVRVDDI
jgi:hypothetical protein